MSETGSQNQSNSQAVHGTRLTALSVYEAIRRDGEEELTRAPLSLWWSGIAAGFAISVSILAEGFIHSKLPDAPWRSLVGNFGYAFGFVIVILGRMQLFTENTITVVLPVIAERTMRSFVLAARLWAIVFVANMAGTLIAASGIYYGIGTESYLHAIIELSSPLMHKGWMDMTIQAIPAGFLVAAIVWMLPNARGFELWMILFTSYIIGIGGFVHIVVGSVEAFMLLFDGQTGVWRLISGFIVPAAIGNIIGGTLLFSLLAYGQVQREI